MQLKKSSTMKLGPGAAVSAMARRGAEKRERKIEDPNDTGVNVEEAHKQVAEKAFSVLEKTQQGIKNALDFGYWFALVFQSQDQADEFIKRAGWQEFVGSSNMFVDGTRVAQKLGVEIPASQRPNPKPSGDKRLIAEVGIVSPEEIRRAKRNTQR